jgi:hypothetical protein
MDPRPLAHLLSVHTTRQVRAEGCVTMAGAHGMPSAYQIVSVAVQLIAAALQYCDAQLSAATRLLAVSV